MAAFSNQATWFVPPAGERSGKPESNEWFIFRNRITVEAPERSILRIAADSKYWLHINGELVVREGGLKRGPVPDGSYYDEVDVSGYLRKGDNTVVVLLCYFGRHGFSHRDSGMPGLLVDADHAAFGTWKVKRHPAYFDAGYLLDAYRLSEGSVGFDARYDLQGWTQAGFDDAAWPAAVPAGKAGDAPWGPLERREFGQWFWSDLKAFESVEASPSEAGDGYTVYRCKLPYNAHFVPALTVKAPAGIRIEITVAQDTNRLCPAYITRDGDQTYEFPGWMNGEEVFYKVPSDAVAVVALQYRETAYPADFAGSFSCDEPLLDTLWNKARRTLVVNMRDNFMDCPCRERAQWPGDMVVQLGQVPYCLGREADLLVKKGLREFLRWQRDDGVIYAPVPEGNWRMELPAQMLSVISPYGIWTYYMNTGDRKTLQELYPYAKRYLDIWEFQDNGLIQYRPRRKGEQPKRVDGVEVGTWDWIDWGERIDAEPALNAWFVLAAEGVRMMAEELGHVSDAAEVGRREKQVRSALFKNFWNDVRGRFVSPGFEFEPDDRVQALAVLCGAAKPEHFASLVNGLESVEQACPYMEKYVLEALFKMGKPDRALARMTRRYRAMVENSNSTLWECWPQGDRHPGTINHAWSGGPLTLLSGNVAGIRPLKPGWGLFSIEPAPGGLRRISASVRIPQGDIRFEARKQGAGWKVEVIVPAGTMAEADFSALGDPTSVMTLPAGARTLMIEPHRVGRRVVSRAKATINAHQQEVVNQP